MGPAISPPVNSSASANRASRNAVLVEGWKRALIRSCRAWGGGRSHCPSGLARQDGPRAHRMCPATRDRSVYRPRSGDGAMAQTVGEYFGRPWCGTPRRWMPLEAEVIPRDTLSRLSHSSDEPMRVAQELSEPSPRNASLELEGDPSLLPDVRRAVEARVRGDQCALVLRLRLERHAPVSAISLEHRERLLACLPCRVPVGGRFDHVGQPQADGPRLVERSCGRLVHAEAVEQCEGSASSPGLLPTRGRRR